MKQPAIASFGPPICIALLFLTPAQAMEPTRSVAPGEVLAPARSETPVRNDMALINLRQDSETAIGEFSVACTGIAGSKEDPRWPSYPLRIEFANDLREHLIGAQIKVWSDERQIMNVTCWAPWLLLKPPGGQSYRVEATIIGESVPAQSANVQAPASGQTRIVLEFPGVDA